jgi:hypothetical protein
MMGFKYAKLRKLQEYRQPFIYFKEIKTPAYSHSAGVG